MKMKNLLKIGLIAATLSTLSIEASAKNIYADSNNACLRIKYDDENSLFSNCLEKSEYFYKIVGNIQNQYSCDSTRLQGVIENLNSQVTTCDEAARVLLFMFNNL